MDQNIGRHYGLFVGTDNYMRSFRRHRKKKHGDNDSADELYDSTIYEGTHIAVCGPEAPYAEYANHRYSVGEGDSRCSQSLRANEAHDTAISLSLSHMPPGSQRFYNQYMSVFEKLSNEALNQSQVPELSRLECLRQLVHTCFNSSQRATPLYSPNTRAGIKETILHVLCAMLCVELTQSQLSLVNSVILLIANNIGCVEDPLFHSTSIPSTVSEWNKYYVRGNNSLLGVLPSDNVECLKHHAVIDPISALEHMLASGVTLADYTSLGVGGASVPDTPVNRQVREMAARHNAMPVGVQIFSDGFQTNAVTRNKGSTWLLEIFCSPPGELRRSKSHSHILALGPSGADHEEVFDYIFNRLALLKTPRHCLVGSAGRVIPCLFVVTCYSADLPERASILNALSFKSNAHKRFGHLMYIPRGDWIDFRLHSCRTCLRKRLVLLRLHEQTFQTDSGSEITCQCCSDWDYFHSRNDRIMQDNDYPTSLDNESPACPDGRGVSDDGRSLMRSIKLTYDVIAKACAVAYHNYSNKTWTKKQSECYMRHCGVNQKLQSLVCEMAKKNHSLLLPAAGGVRREFCRPPPNFVPPALYTMQPIGFECFIESILHLLFKGLHCDILDSLISKVLTLRNMNTKAMIGYNNFLQEVRSHNLSWLNVYPLAIGSSNSGSVTYSTGGWTGANQLSSARLLKVGFSHVRELLPPAAINDVGFMEKYDVLEALLQVFHAMSARVMQPNSSSVSCEEIDNYVKLFLSIVLRFSQLTESGKEPYPFRGGNCLSLLNLSEQRRTHGSPRFSDTWDGDYERGIQMAKDILSNVRMTASFFRTKLEGASSKKALDIAFDEVIDIAKTMTGIEIQLGQRSRVGGSPKIYSGLDQLEDAMRTGLSLHGVLVPIEGTLKASFLVQSDRAACVDVHPAVISDDGGTVSNSCWFSKVSAHHGPPATFMSKEEACLHLRVGFFPKPTLSSVLDNPVADIQGEHHGCYYITSDSWLERSGTGQFILPTIDLALIDRILHAWPLD